jgi:hypothetical protein
MIFWIKSGRFNPNVEKIEIKRKKSKRIVMGKWVKEVKNHIYVEEYINMKEKR